MVGLVLGILLGMAAMVALLGRLGGWSVGAGILAIMTAGFGSFFGGDALRSLRGQAVRGVSVSQAPRFPKAQRFHFTDGMPSERLTARFYKAGHRGPGVTYWAAPVTVEGWRQSEPVTLWVCAGSKDELAEWTKPHRKGLRVGALGGDGCKGAVLAAEQAFGLRSAPNAPVITWLESPQKALQRRLWLALLIPIGLLCLWLVTIPVVWILVRRSGRGQGCRLG
mgnify:CR=1 FL=1